MIASSLWVIATPGKEQNTKRVGSKLFQLSLKNKMVH